MSEYTGVRVRSRPHALPHWLPRSWPAALGLAAGAASLVTGASTVALGITVSLAAWCYLVAAATERPWTAWAAVPAGSLLVVTAEIAGLRWWVAIAAAAAVTALLGLVRRACPAPLRRQIGAIAGFGVLAVVAVQVAGDAGLALAGLTLAGHAGWDLLHLRRAEVVPPSLAIACLGLDVVFGLGAVALAVL